MFMYSFVFSPISGKTPKVASYLQFKRQFYLKNYNLNCLLINHNFLYLFYKNKEQVISKVRNSTYVHCL